MVLKWVLRGTRIGSLCGMKSSGAARSIGSLLILHIAILAIQGCAPQSGSAPKADPVLVENTEIFIDNDSYYLEQVGVASHELDTDLGANGKALQQDTDTSSKKSEVGGSEDSTTKPAAKPAKPGSKPKAAAKPKPKPVDIEFVLTKSKSISVGLSSESPKARTQNDDKAFVPASITKVITTAVALKELGPEFRFKTIVGFDLNSTGQATNLVISADGDPTAGVSSYHAGAPNRMAEIAAAMKAKGVREVIGEIKMVSFDPRMDITSYAAGIPDVDLRECYGSLATSFNFRSNCALARVHSKSGFQWESSSIASFISTEIETSAGNGNSLVLEPMLSPERFFLGFRLRGTYSAKAPRVMQLRLPIGNAAHWYAQGLISALKAAKISANRVTVKFAQTSAERAVAISDLNRLQGSALVVESASLASIVEATNKPSDNFFADSIFKAIGARRGNAADSLVGASRAKIKATLDLWLRADGHGSWSGDLNFIEGAGLSVDNRATPRAFMAVLRQIAREPTFPAIWESLPIAGGDGTLADRMKQTVAAGKVRGKTGTLTGSYQLAGYIPKQRGAQTEYVPFVILTSAGGRDRGLVRQFQDAVVVEMAAAIAREP